MFPNFLYPTKWYSLWSLLLLFCFALFPYPIFAQNTPPPVYVEIQDFVEQKDQFVFQVALTDVRRVHKLYVELWSQNQRVAPRKEYENPRPIVRDAFPKELFRPGGEYEIIVRAEDVLGQMISAPTDRPGERPETVLARYPFKYNVVEPEPIDFTIKAMQPYPNQGLLRIDLGGIDSDEAEKIQLVEGIVFDSNNQVIDSFPLNRLDSLTIDRPLPAQMLPAQVAQKFTLKMQITSVEGLASEEVPFEITIQPAPKITFWGKLSGLWLRLLAGINAQPLLFIGILVVLLNLVGWLLIKGGGKKRRTIITRPPIDVTIGPIPSNKLPGTAKIQVEIIKSPNGRMKKSWTFDTSPITIGRDLKNDLTIDKDGRVSAEHVKVRIEGKKLKIMDCRSSNGTFVGKREITPGQWEEVGSNDTVQLGTRTQIKFSIRP